MMQGLCVSVVDPKSTKDQPKIDQKSTKNQPKKDPKSTPNRPKIDPKKARGRLEASKNDIENKADVKSEKGACIKLHKV